MDDAIRIPKLRKKYIGSAETHSSSADNAPRSLLHLFISLRGTVRFALKRDRPNMAPVAAGFTALILKLDMLRVILSGTAISAFVF
jgi:hypothetical protein